MYQPKYSFIVYIFLIFIVYIILEHPIMGWLIILLINSVFFFLFLDDNNTYVCMEGLSNYTANILLPFLFPFFFFFFSGFYNCHQNFGSLYLYSQTTITFISVCICSSTDTWQISFFFPLFFFSCYPIQALKKCLSPVLYYIQLLLVRLYLIILTNKKIICTKKILNYNY